MKRNAEEIFISEVVMWKMKWMQEKESSADFNPRDKTVVEI